MAHSWKDGLFLKIINVLTYFLFLGFNSYTARDLAVYPSAPETYFTPAPWVYIVWIVIHLLLFGTIIYQFFPSGKEIIIDGISWRFPLASAATALYVHLWGKGQYTWAFIATFPLSGILTFIYRTVKKSHAARHIQDELWIHLPFSLWHGWTAVLWVIAAFEVFGVRSERHPAGTGTKVSVFLALLSLTFTVIAYAVDNRDGDLPAAIPVVISLFAVFDHQRSVDFIHWSALGFAIFATLSTIKSIWGIIVKIRGRNIALADSERGALLGSH